MLMRYLVICLSALLLVSCQLHVSVTGIQDELILIENETGEKLTLNSGDELVSFDHDFSAMSSYDVEIFSHSGQLCKLVYKSGRFTTPYTEIEVKCTQIIDSSSCSDDAQTTYCARVDSNLSCEGCLPQTYITYANKCKAETSDLNPIFIGLEECQIIEGAFSTNDTPAMMTADEVTRDSNITVDAVVFEEDLAVVTITNNRACEVGSYDLTVSKFALNDTQADWAIVYASSDCNMTITEDITFDLKPVKEWYYQSNNLQVGSIDILGGTYLIE